LGGTGGPPRVGEIKEGGRVWNGVGALEDRRPAFHGRRLQGAHPGLAGWRVPLAMKARVAARPWFHIMRCPALCKGGARRRGRQRSVRGKAAFRSPRPVPRASRPLRSQGRAATWAEVMIERGREQSGGACGASLRGGRVPLPRRMRRRWRLRSAERACGWRAEPELLRRAHGGSQGDQTGGRVWNRGVRSGGPEAGFSRPQAPGRTPRPCRMKGCGRR